MGSQLPGLSYGNSLASYAARDRMYGKVRSPGIAVVHFLAAKGVDEKRIALELARECAAEAERIAAES